ncbi:MAG: hypothetical protein HY879_03410 [Deltaproteobacteria bacterium]|nr:hypothetical protein [Deltaproteobacteria bacterium]
MNLPFTIDQFMEIFATYNRAIWPVQIIAYLLGVTALFLAVRRTGYSGRMISAILSCLWIWNGAAYHLTYFSRINKGAFAFGALFIVQGILFFLAGVIKSNLSFRIRRDTSSMAGLLIIAYAMVIYPLIGHLLGHRFPSSPVFGVAPCPTTIFTFGLLLWSERRPSVSLLLIPLIWAIVGSSAVVFLGVLEDIGLITSGLLSASIIFLRGRKVNGREAKKMSLVPAGSR